MKNNQHRFIFLLLALTVMVFSSCSSSKTMKVSRTASFYPDQVRMEISTNDLELLGEQEISVSLSRYFGFIRVFETINGQEVINRNVNQVVLLGDQNMPLSPALRRGLYDVYLKYPDADFLIPSYVIEETENLFLGTKVTQKALIRAYKLNL